MIQRRHCLLGTSPGPRSSELGPRPPSPTGRGCPGPAGKAVLLGRQARKFIPALFLGIAGLAMPARAGQSAISRPGAVCEACHPGLGAAYMHGPHRVAGIACEACHGPTAAHVANPSKANIRWFGKGAPGHPNAVCLSCHAQSGPLQNWASSPHRRAQLQCADCHDIHPDQALPPSRAAQNRLCLRCHQEQGAASHLPYHHPVLENKMTCLDCHDPHGGPAGNGLRAESINQLCYKCHAEYQGPYTYQHPPVTENCLTCHKVHGSVNRWMLNVSQPALCLQCHSGHHDGTNIPLLDPCTSCHSSIHGSDIPSATGGSVFIDKGLQ